MKYDEMLQQIGCFEAPKQYIETQSSHRATGLAVCTGKRRWACRCVRARSPKRRDQGDQAVAKFQVMRF
jgi:hypothetical protein